MHFSNCTIVFGSSAYVVIPNEFWVQKFKIPHLDA